MFWVLMQKKCVFESLKAQLLKSLAKGAWYILYVMMKDKQELRFASKHRINTTK